MRTPAFVVRFTHWLTAAAFFALLLTGLEIVVSHPRFYWGETGNVNMEPLFRIPIPASRGIVPTGYGYVLPDQNGWSRALHFQSAWLVALAGLLYVAYGFLSRHFRRSLLPDDPDGAHYNPQQRVAYALIVFVVFPLIIWTGLAMSPGVTSAFPAVVTTWGGHQTARTVHFFLALLLAAFVGGHIVLALRARRLGTMIFGERRPQ